MKKQAKELTGLFIRYAIILVLGFGNLFLIYKILTPITIETTAFILNLFSETYILDSLIISEILIIEIIPACIAGSAYYLLLILILATPKIKLPKRIQILAFSLVILFIFNIARIVLLTSISNTSYFETTHLLFWYFISTIFVAGIWIASIKLFKIKSIPIYSDLKFLYGLVKPGKETKRHR